MEAHQALYLSRGAMAGLGLPEIPRVRSWRRVDGRQIELRHSYDMMRGGWTAARGVSPCLSSRLPLLRCRVPTSHVSSSSFSLMNVLVVISPPSSQWLSQRFPVVDLAIQHQRLAASPCSVLAGFSDRFMTGLAQSLRGLRTAAGPKCSRQILARDKLYSHLACIAAALRCKRWLRAVQASGSCAVRCFRPLASLAKRCSNFPARARRGSGRQGL